MGGEHVTDFVRRAPVFVGLGLGAHVHNQIEEGAGFSFVSAAFSVALLCLDAEHLAQEGVEGVLKRGDVFGGQRHQSGRRPVDGFHAFKQGGNQDGGVEVVVHRCRALRPKRGGVKRGFSVRRGQFGQGIHGLFQLGKALFGRLQGFVAEVQGACVMAHQHEEPHRHRRVALVEQFVVSGDEFVGGETIAFGLGHLPAIHRQHVAVHPVVHGAFTACGADVLGDFTLVVRELEVHASPVNVKLLSEVFGAHHRTLQVPSREPLSPRRRPLHEVTCIGGFPKGKIQGIALFALAV